MPEAGSLATAGLMHWDSQQILAPRPQSGLVGGQWVPPRCLAQVALELLL